MLALKSIAENDGTLYNIIMRAIFEKDPHYSRLGKGLINDPNLDGDFLNRQRH